jgi:hypothetical protein
MKNSLILGLAGLAALGVGSAHSSDICKTNMKKGPVYYCGMFAYSAQAPNMFTTTFGPGNAFAITGVGGTNGDSGSGTFACPGNNFVSTSYTTNTGNTPIWYARFYSRKPATGGGYDPVSGLQASISLTPGACSPLSSRSAPRSKAH